MLMVPSSIIYSQGQSVNRVGSEKTWMHLRMRILKEGKSKPVSEAPKLGQQSFWNEGVCAQFFCIKRTQQYSKVNMKLKINYIHYCFCK